MDILGLNQGNDEMGDGIFIKHSATTKGWMIGSDTIEVKDFLVDTTTIKTGWGMYDGQYHYVWDEKPGVVCEKPSVDHRRAFSVWIYIPNQGAKVWRRTSYGEGEGFNALCTTFWNEMKNNPDKCPHLQYTGSVDKKFKIGGTSIPEFAFVKWADRPDDFVVQNIDTRDANPNVDIEAKVDAALGLTPKSEDDLPF